MSYSNFNYCKNVIINSHKQINKQTSSHLKVFPKQISIQQSLSNIPYFQSNISPYYIKFFPNKSFWYISIINVHYMIAIHNHHQVVQHLIFTITLIIQLTISHQSELTLTIIFDITIHNLINLLKQISNSYHFSLIFYFFPTLNSSKLPYSTQIFIKILSPLLNKLYSKQLCP